MLTAAHVVAGGAPESWTFNLNLGGDLTARAAGRLDPGAPRLPGLRARARRPRARRHRGRPARGDRAVRHPALRARARAPRLGERLILVGYGSGGSSGGGASAPGRSGGEARRGERRRAGVSGPRRGAGRVELYRFAYTPLPGGSPLEATLAGGDSGSPAFVREPEGWRLAGINTYVYSARGQSGGGGVAVAAYREWILSVIARE